MNTTVEHIETKKSFREFMNATKSKEILIIILKSNLYLERELIQALTCTIIDEKILGTTTFRQKLDLAHSMGIIDDIYGTLGKVNSIRNAYAHDLNYEFGEKEFEDLLSTLPKEEKDAYVAEYDEWKLLYDSSIPEFNFRLQILLAHIWFAMNGCKIYAKRSIEMKLKEKELEHKYNIHI